MKYARRWIENDARNDGAQLYEYYFPADVPDDRSSLTLSSLSSLSSSSSS